MVGKCYIRDYPALDGIECAKVFSAAPGRVEFFSFVSMANGDLRVYPSVVMPMEEFNDCRYNGGSQYRDISQRGFDELWTLAQAGAQRAFMHACPDYKIPGPPIPVVSGLSDITTTRVFFEITALVLFWASSVVGSLVWYHHSPGPFTAITVTLSAVGLLMVLAALTIEGADYLLGAINDLRIRSRRNHKSP